MSTPDHHKTLGVKRMDGPFGFAKAGHAVPLTVTEAAYTWRETTGGVTADYVLDKATRRVSATANGEAVPLSNPQCGKSARLVPR